MKGIIILSLVLLAGCGTYTPLEQLEANALASGDWSAVEQRERLKARRKSSSGIECPSDMVGFCQTSASGRRCECVEHRVVRSFLDGL